VAEGVAAVELRRAFLSARGADRQVGHRAAAGARAGRGAPAGQQLQLLPRHCEQQEKQEGEQLQQHRELARGQYFAYKASVAAEVRAQYVTKSTLTGPGLGG
jgi:hypothetical protein